MRRSFGNAAGLETVDVEGGVGFRCGMRVELEVRGAGGRGWRGRYGGVGGDGGRCITAAGFTTAGFTEAFTAAFIGLRGADWEMLGGGDVGHFCGGALGVSLHDSFNRRG